MLSQFKHLLDSPVLGPLILLAMIATGIMPLVVPI
jgi:hypothetical protein